LGSFPLALSQAAAYMREDIVTAERYLELFDEAAPKALERLKTFPGFTLDGHEKSILTTWEMSYRRIGGFSNPKSKAAHLLDQLAFCNVDHMEDEIVTHVLKCIRVTEDGQSGNAISTLVNFNLITKDPKADVFSMHLLVAFWVTKRLEAKPVDFKACIGDIVWTLGEIISYDDIDKPYAPFRALVVPHALRLLKVGKGLITYPTERPEVYAGYTNLQFGCALLLALELGVEGEVVAIDILRHSVYEQGEMIGSNTYARQLLLGKAYYNTFHNYLEMAIEEFGSCANHASSPEERDVALRCMDIAMMKAGKGNEAVEQARIRLEKALEEFESDSLEAIDKRNQLAETLRMNAFSFWDTPTLTGPGAAETVMKMLTDNMDRLHNGPARLAEEPDLTKTCIALFEKRDLVVHEICLDCLGREVERELHTDERSSLCMASIRAHIGYRGPMRLLRAYAYRLQLGKAHPARQFHLASKFAINCLAWLDTFKEDETEDPDWRVIIADVIGQRGENLMWVGNMVKAEMYLRSSLEMRSRMMEKGFENVGREVVDINIDSLGVVIVGQGDVEKFSAFLRDYGPRVGKTSLLPAPENDLSGPYPRFYKSLRVAQAGMHELASVVEAVGEMNCEWCFVRQELEHLPETGEQEQEPEQEEGGVVPVSLPWKLKVKRTGTVRRAIRKVFGNSGSERGAAG
jgi:hypothetical protein